MMPRTARSCPRTSSTRRSPRIASTPPACSFRCHSSASKRRHFQDIQRSGQSSLELSPLRPRAAPRSRRSTWQIRRCLESRSLSRQACPACSRGECRQARSPSPEGEQDGIKVFLRACADTQSRAAACGSSRTTQDRAAATRRTETIRRPELPEPTEPPAKEKPLTKRELKAEEARERRAARKAESADKAKIPRLIEEIQKEIKANDEEFAAAEKEIGKAKAKLEQRYEKRTLLTGGSEETGGPRKFEEAKSRRQTGDLRHRKT